MSAISETDTFRKCLTLIEEKEELKLTSVWVGEIEDKEANTIMKKLCKEKKMSELAFLRRVSRNPESGKLTIIYNTTQEGADDYNIQNVREIKVPSTFPTDSRNWKQWGTYWPLGKPSPPPSPHLPENMTTNDVNHIKKYSTLVNNKEGNVAIVVTPNGKIISEAQGGWGGSYTKSHNDSTTDPLDHCLTRLIQQVAKYDRESDLNAKRTSSDQYLFTNYDIFTTEEPCVMCAMALVHSRVGRIFFLRKNTVFGGCGGVHSIHSCQQLNHHFEAYHVNIINEET